MALSASWMTDGTVPNDPAFFAWMQQLATDQFKQNANTWLTGLGGNPNDPKTFNTNRIPTNPDGSIDYTKLDTGGQGGNLGSYYQELGEGNQGRQLYNFFKQGLTTNQINQAYQSAPGGSAGHWQRIEGGGEGIPDSQVWIPDKGIPTGLVAQPLFNHSSETGHNTGEFGFDPLRGFLTAQTNTNVGTGGWDKFGDMLPIIIASLMTMGGGAAIGAVGGAAGGFGAGGLGSGGTSAFNALTRTLFNADGTSGAAGGGGNPARAIGAGLFPALLQFLMRGGR
jgi:hypothetical protein